MDVVRQRFENGRGSTQQDYLAFWTDGRERSASAVHVVYPPHEEPRGGILDELIVAALRDKHREVPEVQLLGAVSMYGTDREIVLGDGRVASAALEGTGWRVHL